MRAIQIQILDDQTFSVLFRSKQTVVQPTIQSSDINPFGTDGYSSTATLYLIVAVVAALLFN